MEQVKEKVTFKKFLDILFGNNHFEEDLTEELKRSHLFETMNKIDEIAETFNTPVHSEGNKSSNGGFSKKIEIKEIINSETLEKMRKYKKSIGEREGGEGREK